MLFLNGDFQFVWGYEEYDHEFFAHVPHRPKAGPRSEARAGHGRGRWPVAP
ncbi:MAG: hypothetical protein U5R48_18870 [Gammaproteobacteria bacterium]|nr:hypothetical protein [Gammaproteobacteria bacterium]